jgi:hypothetical protein
VAHNWLVVPVSGELETLGYIFTHVNSRIMSFITLK